MWRWRQRGIITIRVTTSAGTAQFEERIGWRFGALTVHEELPFHVPTISHAPTGLQLFESYNRPLAAFALRLLLAADLNWSAIDSLEVAQQHEAQVRRLVDRIERRRVVYRVLARWPRRHYRRRGVWQ